MKYFFISSKSKDALKAKKKYKVKYGNYKINEADIIIPIGGDGFLLKSLHDFSKFNIPFYGINYGSIGFLMNTESKESLDEIITKAQKIQLRPLKMKATDYKGKIFQSIAFNEVSIMRQTHQAAKISIKINNIERIKELICDGVLVSTAAGSTAYNFSAHGSIIPLESKLLALTPISSFRPRRWRGALLTEDTKIVLTVNDVRLRASSVTADNKEIRNIKKVEISTDKKYICDLLFNNHHSIQEKILKEQFSQ
ncbi:MAG: NAD kinase [Alphaproteobacteria bacterium MarineAlpha5_Bin8]|nr:MAG: NAD kinase [Alphaproteobacteria bacterium MarineAlpha5_Bin8]PPR45969.1 MAG: NAD kinase [Alphaproteobacteria bacterium MarineAlpha5_Bin7]|tara:strand:+ start:1251 stop:2009 length:759 start_codon:yes stop_codon:yes gene_type:complete